MSEPVAWRWIADHKYLCASEPEEPVAHHWEPLYPADAIERKDAAIAELKAENRALSNRAIDCEMSWTHERAERAEMAITELVQAGRAIIARWHSPFWKDARHTGEYIAELQAVCDKYDIPKDGL